MTPAAALREHAARLEREAQEMRALAATLDGEAMAPSAPQTIGVAVAAKIMRVSEATAYRHGRRFGLAWQTPAGGWCFDRRKVVAFAAARRDEIERPVTEMKQSSLFTDASETRIFEARNKDDR